MKKISFLIFSAFFAFCSQAYAKNTLQGGESLLPGDKLVSSSGEYELRMQNDGNLVLYKIRTNSKGDSWTVVLWAAHTTGNNGAKAVMQASDGNFVVYSTNNGPLWATFKTASFSNKNSKLLLQNDGNLVIYKPDMTPIWHTGTVDEPQNCTTKTIDMWGGKVQDGYIWNTNTKCTVYVQLVPSSQEIGIPYKGVYTCMVKPAYAGKRSHTTCK
ncbi:hypothetical protein [Microbulbifer variabilis]|uniref:hypothetical protein n=1 Tax=Microbulbifer variabilis TaxID=266805 RepID=UPI000370595A|nr:hypothetical protein [Microbulbifer variabilis]